MNPILIKNLTAGGTVNQYRFLKIGASDGVAIQAASALSAILGVVHEMAQNLGITFASGDRFDADVAGISEVMLGDTVTRGDALTSDANGKAITANFVPGTTSYIGGFALASGVAGDVIPVLIAPSVLNNTEIIAVAQKTITTGQLLALNATAIEVIPAPGANKAIVLLDAVAYLPYNSAAYAGIAGGEDLVLAYTDVNGTALAKFETTGFLDQTSDQVRIAAAELPKAGTNLTPTVNAAVVAALLSGEITTGDSPLKIRARYRVVDTAW